MRWRQLLIIPLVPMWLIFLWYCLMLLAYSWDFTRWGIGQPSWTWPGSVLLFSSFVLTNVAAFKASPGARFPIALAAAVLGSGCMWKSQAHADRPIASGELIYTLCFVTVALAILYYGLRWATSRDDAFNE